LKAADVEEFNSAPQKGPCWGRGEGKPALWAQEG
jgi:hypothetical protein